MKTSPLTPRCPIRTTLELLGGKWQLLILDRLGEEAVAFTDLKLRLHPISDKVLAHTLQRLRESKLVDVVGGKYRRTKAGTATGPLLAAIVAYGQEYERLLAET
ncbi:winged helix-turn-helix transcriptional regulator [Neolewinella antarctica]|uniref:DNA-binding HxlR family transcriptional regulator n=1 Tax=Neolewinella antarctica TaxID=442734 RepID=A0ABX0XB61_9BACT|nr:helix-turn-helix domain-containing protein [Neolewinella antarctica]NJC26514.1 DNA-binding HxlR family transcriptional regulator [Neolewinella antarctica]